MKKILILIAILMANMPLLTAQDFHITEKGIIWMNTYETDMNSTELLKALYVANIASEIIPIDETMIVGKMRPTAYDYESYGMSRMKIPFFISQNALGPAFFIMQIKEGKYRIILQEIKLTAQVNTQMTPYGSITRLDSEAIGNDGFSGNFETYGRNMYNDVLTKVFTLSKISEEW